MREEINFNELEQVAGGMANPDEEVYVTVAGDTLWGIAQKRRTTVDWLFNKNKEEIKKWAHQFGKYSNNDEDYKNWLWIGERLYVPRIR